MDLLWRLSCNYQEHHSTQLQAISPYTARMIQPSSRRLWSTSKLKKRILIAKSPLQRYTLRRRSNLILCQILSVPYSNSQSIFKVNSPNQFSKNSLNSKAKTSSILKRTAHPKQPNSTRESQKKAKVSGTA